MVLEGGDVGVADAVEPGVVDGAVVLVDVGEELVDEEVPEDVAPVEMVDAVVKTDLAYLFLVL